MSGRAARGTVDTEVAVLRRSGGVSCWPSNVSAHRANEKARQTATVAALQWAAVRKQGMLCLERIAWPAFASG